VKTQQALEGSLLGPEFVSEYLGVPVTTIYQWRTKGTGPRAIKIGRHLRYRREDVEAWVESQADDARVGAA
jgi:excisionase family DNA binding protein